jgi:hypothetical protein
MAYPPRYHRLEDEESGVTEDASFLKSAHDEASPYIRDFTYPPRDPREPVVHVTTSMIYTFNPRYPVPGNVAHAFGILGQDKTVRCDTHSTQQ